MLIAMPRDERGADAIEVCMLRRNLDSEFVAGVVRVPRRVGRSPTTGERTPRPCAGAGPTPQPVPCWESSREGWPSGWRPCGSASRRPACWWPIPADAVADRDGTVLLDTSDPEVATRFAAYRDAVNAQETMGLLDVCRAEGLVLATDTVHYVSHWITPELAPRRYDTRFFLTVAPPGQVARHDDGETIATIWVRPGGALARHAAGDIELMPPTIANLEHRAVRLHRSEVMAWAGASPTSHRAARSWSLIEDGQVLILRPGDEGYEPSRPSPTGDDKRLRAALGSPRKDGVNRSPGRARGGGAPCGDPATA
jgi:hypothetical protein